MKFKKENINGNIKGYLLKYKRKYKSFIFLLPL